MQPPKDFFVTYEILPEIFAYAAGFFLVLYLLYRRYIFSILDPLFVFVVTTAFASVLAVGILPSPALIAHFFGCQLCLFAGFALVQERFRSAAVLPDQEVPGRDLKVLELTVYLLLGLYLLANVVLLATKGAPLLSDIPTRAKINYFKGGFGLIRKINWSAGGFLGFALLYLYLIDRQRKYLFLLLLVALLTVLEGSKSALLRIVFSFALLVYHPLMRRNTLILATFKRYVPLGVAAVLVVFFVILFKEATDPGQVGLAFIKRLIWSGDSLIFYYQPINQSYFSSYSMADFPAYIVNPVLGFFRLTPYMEGFGNLMYKNLVPEAPWEEFVGPNTPFFIEGKIFFGYYGAFFYSLLVGALYSGFRIFYFSYRGGSAFWLVFLGYLCQMAITFFTETKLAITVLFDTCFFIIPVFLISRFLLTEKKGFPAGFFRTGKDR